MENYFNFELSKKMREYIKEQINQIDIFNQYLSYIDLFLYNIQEKDYNSAFNNYLKADFEKERIKNRKLALDSEKLEKVRLTLIKVLQKLTKNINIIGFDLVEISPNLDLPNNMTSNLTAKLIIELISFISNSY